MKKFVLTTKSESGDDYIYIIRHPEEPTEEELKRFLREHAHDQDEDTIYEHIGDISQIDVEGLTIPEYDPNNPNNKKAFL
ncbi:MAG: hypothetical protein AABY15_03175 [Nanoarchaeota archaeon]|mgnify:CR=1 FL=1